MLKNFFYILSRVLFIKFIKEFFGAVNVVYLLFPAGTLHVDNYIGLIQITNKLLINKSIFNVNLPRRFSGCHFKHCTAYTPVG